MKYIEVCSNRNVLIEMFFFVFKWSLEETY